MILLFQVVIVVGVVIIIIIYLVIHYKYIKHMLWIAALPPLQVCDFYIISDIKIHSVKLLWFVILISHFS
jgi:hypothetical protein